MKTQILILLILISFHSFGQDEKADKIQTEWYQKAEISLDSSKIRNAFHEYEFSFKMVPESKLGKNSKKLSDSLKIILRTELIEDLNGTWELKIFNKIKSEADKIHYQKLGEYLKFRNDSIFFYKNKSNLKLHKPTKIQKIEFCDLETTFPHYSDIVHTDNKIWDYFIDSTNNKLIIEENGELSRDGKSRSWVGSHPSGYTYYRIK
ncbi:hypothetical protein [Gillisia sp. CAL575]|uniref:hypothetical protein n=1 Tax=Gillisia sp. CAL575 TaxID=985255 RepID=UPI000399B503|nr:hypothetical protein [Gillisia sp. CAL575]